MEIYNVLKSRDYSKKKLKHIENQPMGDDTIKTYLPNAKIITYPELSKYETIEQLLPKNKDYVIILYLQRENDGHWTAVYNDDNVINFFCSYGSSPSTPLNWTSPEQKIILNQQIPYLDILLSKTKKNVLYNPIDYQNKNNNDIATCGRHIVMRILTFLKHHMDLNQYLKFMNKLRKVEKKTYDEVVSEYVDRL